MQIAIVKCECNLLLLVLKNFGEKQDRVILISLSVSLSVLNVIYFVHSWSQNRKKEGVMSG